MALYGFLGDLSVYCFLCFCKLYFIVLIYIETNLVDYQVVSIYNDSLLNYY